MVVTWLIVAFLYRILHPYHVFPIDFWLMYSIKCTWRISALSREVKDPLHRIGTCSTVTGANKRECVILKATKAATDK